MANKKKKTQSKAGKVAMEQAGAHGRAKQAKKKAAKAPKKLEELDLLKVQLAFKEREGAQKDILLANQKSERAQQFLTQRLMEVNTKYGLDSVNDSIDIQTGVITIGGAANANQT